MLYGYVPSSSLLASVKIVADTEENNNRTQLMSLRESGDSFVPAVVVHIILLLSRRETDARSRGATFAAWTHRSIHVHVRHAVSVDDTFSFERRFLVFAGNCENSCQIST